MAQKVFDALLVLRYRTGDKKALGLLVDRYHNKLCRHAYWYTHDVAASKDIVQDCWGSIIKKIAHLRDPNNFGCWAMRIVTRKSIDYLNREKRHREKLKEYTPISEESDDEDGKPIQTELKKAINRLSNDQQIVLRLFYTENYSLNEITEILGISVGTVKSRLFHAREKLKVILK